MDSLTLEEIVRYHQRGLLEWRETRWYLALYLHLTGRNTLACWAVGWEAE